MSFPNDIIRVLLTYIKNTYFSTLVAFIFLISVKNSISSFCVNELRSESSRGGLTLVLLAFLGDFCLNPLKKIP